MAPAATVSSQLAGLQQWAKRVLLAELVAPGDEVSRLDSPRRGRVHHGRAMAARWPRDGRAMGGRWVGDGWAMGVRWVCDGWAMGERWVCDGWAMGGRWVGDGCAMAARWVGDGWAMGGRWVCDGCAMGGRWVSDGCAMGVRWVCDGWAMGVRWVCEMFCGRGEDTPLWVNAHIASYLGVDVTPSSLEEAAEEWRAHGAPYGAAFHYADPSLFLANVAALLLPGGIFFGLLPDSSTLWYARLLHALVCPTPPRSGMPDSSTLWYARLLHALVCPTPPRSGMPDSSTLWYARLLHALACPATCPPLHPARYKQQRAIDAAKAAAGPGGAAPTRAVIRSSLYSIAFEKAVPFDDNKAVFDLRFSLKCADANSLPIKSLLVHFPTLIRLAEVEGLQLIDIVNLETLFNDTR
ncbi:unnamed protein product [Closterium sp. Yama58-4]|nr:unnamed protein product [Closterium sp. Yama58-4]